MNRKAKNLNYGIIGNGRTAALISDRGDIEWGCLPDFDSSSVFARLLDIEKGGEFAIYVEEDYKVNQAYVPKTNILVTAFTQGRHRFEVIDFMPRYHSEYDQIWCPPDIIRYIRHVSGKPKVRFHYDPRPSYAQFPVKTEIRREYIKTGTLNGSYESVYLYSDLHLEDIAAERPITIDRDAFCLVSYNQKLADLDLDYIQLEYEKTRVYWLDWSAKTPKVPRYNAEVQRSALVLKLLAFQRTGAILAAVTTSLPETIGAERNWDYRFCWLRDASMTINVLKRLNHFNVAMRFYKYILQMIPFKDEKIQIMYGINGQKKLTEKFLNHLAGYENSQPVRIGNAAYTQKQNDIFGILIEAIYRYLTTFKRGQIYNREDLWTVVRSLARNVEHQWRQPDMSIWEFRTRKQHFTFSKVLSWVAMDRAAQIAQFFDMPKYVDIWTRIRDVIKADILKKGWNEEIQAFTQAYGQPYLDAANLLMESYGFIAADDPKYVSTVCLTEQRLCRDGLMYRYLNEDDFGKPQSSFTVCTFWLIRSLYKVGETEKAERMFEKVLQYSNHLGLFSEDIDFETKRLLGNFPQGYSHLALIDTILTLNDRE